MADVVKMVVVEKKRRMVAVEKKKKNKRAHSGGLQVEHVPVEHAQEIAWEDLAAKAPKLTFWEVSSLEGASLYVSGVSVEKSGVKSRLIC